MYEFIVQLETENIVINGDSMYESEGVLKITLGERTVAIFADGEWKAAFPSRLAKNTDTYTMDGHVYL